MLKKQNRLARISKAKEAQVFSTPLFNLKILKGVEGEKKFGFIVSKKVSKSAVLRNKTKRILRAAIVEELERIITGKDFLLISKKQLDWKQKDEVKETIDNAFKKAKLIK